MARKTENNGKYRKKCLEKGRILMEEVGRDVKKVQVPSCANEKEKGRNAGRIGKNIRRHRKNCHENRDTH